MSFEEDVGGGGASNGGGGGSGYIGGGGGLVVAVNNSNNTTPGIIHPVSTPGTGTSSVPPQNTVAGGSEEELNCTLWVGNLDSQVTEDILADVFIQCGPIAKIHIPKGKDGLGHKGYCFVQFANEETVPYSMSVMEGTQLFGKLLRLQPRPGSKHRKILDQLHAEKQQQLQVQHHQQLLQQQTQPQQWFVSAAPHPQQMAQFQNVLLYPPQMFQPYGGIPNMNMNSSLIPTIQYSPGMGLPLMQMVARPQQQQIPVQPQQSSQINPHHTPRGPRAEYRSSRPTRPQMNGFHQQRPQHNGSAQPSHFNNSTSSTNASTPTCSSANSSSHQQSHQQVLNGSHSTRFPHPRGPRPQQHRLHHQQQTAAPRNNGNNTNNNNISSTVMNGTRVPFNNHQRSVTTISTQHLPHPQHSLQSPTSNFVQQQLIPTALYQSPPPATHYSFPTLTPAEQQQFFQQQQQQQQQQHHRRPTVVQQIHPHAQAAPQQTAGLVSFPVANLYQPYQ